DAHQVAILPDRVLRVEPDVRLRAERDLHLGDLAAVEFLVDLLRDPVECVHRLVRGGHPAFLLTRHRAPLPSRRSPSRLLPQAPPREPPRLRPPPSSASCPPR